ncbi:MAG: hypothetical protein HWN81_00315 [Candidatus Lokiarchaeota archaeon]|nr:hypothetical protein [Candidatus Lokiarchaeota archaeon]
MSVINQRQAVVNAVKNVLGDSFTPNSTKVKEVLTIDQLKEVRNVVLKGILQGNVAYGKPTTDTKEVDRYVSGMVANYLRKAKELNGGTKYTPTKTGAKRDTTLLNLNRLLSNYTEGTDEYDEVKEAITARQQELKGIKASKTKVSKNAVDISVLPEELANIIE